MDVDRGVIGHGAIVRELRALAALPEPPHALLLAGPEGLGRTRLAIEYALALNCEAATTGEKPCLACRPCRLITQQAHPDLALVAPGDSFCKPRAGESAHERHPNSRDIRICQIRGIADLVARYPVEARFRVVLIEPAERLNREAQAALLKTLEEPPPHTAFVLVSAAPESITETIRSRCRRIDVRPVPTAELIAGLLERGADEETARAVARAARGRPAHALRVLEQPDLLGDADRLLERCRAVAQALPSERLAYAGELAERYRRDRSLVAGELDAWEAFWEARLREGAEGDLEAARGALRALRAVEQARRDLLTNVQPRLAFDLMLLRFPRVTLGSSQEVTHPHR